MKPQSPKTFASVLFTAILLYACTFEDAPLATKLAPTAAPTLTPQEPAATPTPYSGTQTLGPFTGLVDAPQMDPRNWVVPFQYVLPLWSFGSHSYKLELRCPAVGLAVSETHNFTV